MNSIMASCVATLVILIACIIGYIRVTNGIIKDQEKRIAKLNTENIRLQAALRKASCTKQPQIIEIHDNTISPENVPGFKNF